VACLLLWCCWCSFIVVGVVDINATSTREKCIQQSSASSPGKYSI
jgi:hypothetical protein